MKSDNKKYDAFLSYASEDSKIAFKLASILRDKGFTIWYDKFILRPGDSISSAIDEGLTKSRFGIIILSHFFFKKSWTKRELSGLVALQMDGSSRIIPIWYKVEKQDVLEFSPPLADIVAIKSSIGLDELINETGVFT